MSISNKLSVLWKVAGGSVPPRVLLYAALGLFNKVFRTGNRRFEFEWLYLEHGDVWSYRTRPEERIKYDSILEMALRYRRKRNTVLDTACSVGVLSAKLAQHFDKVVAFDLSQEALRLAQQDLAHLPNVETKIADIRKFELDRTFDVIICAGILRYLADEESDALCRRLAEHLATDGILVVEYSPEFRSWDERLKKYFFLLNEAHLPNGWGYVSAFAGPPASPETSF
jgi:2-polyprenyl-3-methyl-5-hydroxy-6-metoxy-1,4-benzoquinol methylase